MLTQLKVNQLRNLKQVDVTLTHCNVFIGDNGSGKTSLLESVFLLSRGKSFRHHQPRHYINHQAHETVVFAKLTSFTNKDIQQTDFTVAVAKSRNSETKLRLAGQTVASQSEITKQLPVQRLDPSLLDLLDQGSNSRRQLLDWLAFHVEPLFHSTWLAYQRVLKQRNRLLKQTEITTIVKQQLQGWDNQLADLAMQLHNIRQAVFLPWQNYFANYIEQFLPQYKTKLDLTYQAGFDTQQPLQQTLVERLEKDVNLGYTRVGAHRADIHVVLDKHNAADVLSRGEKKLLITALKLAQLHLLYDRNSRALVLLDDITAELDEVAIARLLAGLAKCESQLFITSLDSKIQQQINQYWQQTATLFHVEHGKITPYETDLVKF